MTNPSSQTGSRRLEQLGLILRRPDVALSLVAVCIFAVYYGTLFFEFVWDDTSQIVNNPLIRHWSITRVFLNDLWFHTNRSQVYYRPLFVIWSILNFKIFGLMPWGWHLSTALLHIAASCTIYVLARALRLDYATALLATILFGFHPIHMECAAWISAGSDSMVTIFFVLAFVAFLKWYESQSHRGQFLTASGLLLSCALLTKEMAVTFPIIVFVYVSLVSKEAGSALLRLRRAVLAAAPYVILTIGYFVLRRLVLHRTSELDPYHSNLNVILTLPLVLFSYLRLLIFPKGLTGLYYIPYVTKPGPWNFVFPCTVLIAASALLWYWFRRKKDPLIAFAAVWLIIGLLPVLYLRLFPPGGAVRDRYVYLPSVGFVLLLAMAIRLLAFYNERQRAILLQGALVAALCIAFIAGILLQQVYWGNNLLLFYRGYSLYPQNTYAGIELAAALIKKNRFGQGIAVLTAIIQEDPSNGSAYYQLAEAYVRTGQKAEARKALDTALELNPEAMQSEAAQSDIANIFAQLGDYQTALRLYLQVLEREPELYSALYNGGYTYFLRDQDAQSEKLLQRAMRVAPDYAAPVFYLGRIYLRTGKPELAEIYFKKALAIDPHGYDFHYWLGETMAARGQYSRALDEYAEELKFYPKNPNALASLNKSSNRSQSQ